MTRMRASASCSRSHLAIKHHEDAFAAALCMPDDAALAPRDPLLRGFHGEELMRPRNFLVPGIEDDKIADQIEQPGLIAELRERPVEEIVAEGAGGEGAAGLPRRLVFPLDEELFRRSGRAVAQALRIAARQHHLHRAEEGHVEDFFLVGDQLPHAFGHFH